MVENWGKSVSDKTLITSKLPIKIETWKWFCFVPVIKHYLLVGMPFFDFYFHANGPIKKKKKKTRGEKRENNQTIMPISVSNVIIILVRVYVTNL